MSSTGLETSTDQSLLRRIKKGHSSAATAIYSRYVDRIRALACAKMPDHLKCRVDPDDVSQSVFRNFFEAASHRLYDVPDGETLWRLLAVATVNKVRSLHEFHAAKRRDARATRSAPDDTIPIEDDDLMEVAVRDILEHLPEQERQVIELRLEGYAETEIAVEMTKSLRSVERLMQRARAKLLAILEESKTN